MATILVLKPAMNQAETPRATTAAHSAEIIFFPGVRYERWTDDSAAASAEATSETQKRKRRSRVKRDKMTISL
jgi:hypothetical protein